MADSLSVAVGTVAACLHSLSDTYSDVDNVTVLQIGNPPDSASEGARDTRKPMNVIQFTLNDRWYEVTVTEARTPRISESPAGDVQSPLQRVSLGSHMRGHRTKGQKDTAASLT